MDIQRRKSDAVWDTQNDAAANAKTDIAA